MDARREYWLFQYTQGVSVERRFESSARGDKVPWKLTRYKQRIKEGDVVFFWRAGKQAGLKGWGVVEGSTLRRKDEDFDRVSVRVEAIGTEPIPRDEVRAVPELLDLGVVMQGRQGTNFPVSARQARGLARLLETNGLPPPEVGAEELASSAKRRAERALSKLSRAAQRLEGTELHGKIEALKAGLADGSGLDQRLEELRAGLDELTTVPDADLRDAVQQIRIEIPNIDGPPPVVGRDLAPGPASPAGDSVPEGVREAPSPFQPATDAQPAEVPQPAAQPPAEEPVWPWEELDYLGIADDVNNLARYIARRDLIPPRAIGIFGDWGSGKTFFMHAVQSQIAMLAWQSRLALQGGRSTMFCGHVVQIEFNAWHYVESNLWASLAGHVFEQLHKALARREQADAATRGTDAFFRTLETYREAVRERDELRQRIEELAKQRADLEHELAKRRSSKQLLRRKLFESVAERLQDSLQGIARDQRARISAMLGEERVKAAAQAGEEVAALLPEARSLGQSLLTDLRLMGAGTLILAFGAVGAVAALPILALYVFDQSAITQALASLATFVTTATGAASWLTHRARTVMDAARKGQALIAEARTKAEAESSPDLDAAARAEQEALDELGALDGRLREQRQELKSLQAALAAKNVAVQLKQFLEERVRGRSYEQYLGLETMVRRDFERLSSLMEAFWATRRSPKPVAEVDGFDENGQAVRGRVPFIERIVLYVDDLDRCHTRTVVDVLQAIHLMLGFKLFVVVVGVDVRWIGRCLLKHYPELLVDRRANAGAASARWSAASPDDYLEKIFQIPFRILPMSHEARGELVKGMLQESSAPRAQLPAQRTPTPLELNPRELEINPEEVLAIESLHACVGSSPRRVRRFADVYRLMRAGMDEGNVESLMVTRRYRVVLAMFALLSGSPHLGSASIERIHAALRKDELDVDRGLCAWFDRLLPDLDVQEPEEIESARRVFEYLDSLEPEARTDLPDALREWLPSVVRYSFWEVRLSRG